MYDFIDTVKRKCRRGHKLPTSAMNYNGLFFEEAIEGYRTLSVSGREMLSVDISSDSVSVGSIISNQSIPPRILTVSYQLINDDPEKILVNYRRLMEYLLQENDVEIYFNDERDLVYCGRYSASGDVPGDSYSFTSSFDIYCQDPRKYTQTFETDGYIGGQLPWKTRPERIEVVISCQGSLVISDGDKKISMTGTNFHPGDIVEVLFTHNRGKILVNGENKTLLLDMNSDFENFYLKYGQTITSSNGPIKIYYREVSL